MSLIFYSFGTVVKKSYYFHTFNFKTFSLVIIMNSSILKLSEYYYFILNIPITKNANNDEPRMVWILFRVDRLIGSCTSRIIVLNLKATINHRIRKPILRRELLLFVVFRNLNFVCLNESSDKQFRNVV